MAYCSCPGYRFCRFSLFWFDPSSSSSRGVSHLSQPKSYTNESGGNQINLVSQHVLLILLLQLPIQRTKKISQVFTHISLPLVASSFTGLTMMMATSTWIFGNKSYTRFNRRRQQRRSPAPHRWSSISWRTFDLTKKNISLNWIILIDDSLNVVDWLAGREREREKKRFVLWFGAAKWHAGNCCVILYHLSPLIIGTSLFTLSQESSLLLCYVVRF